MKWKPIKKETIDMAAGAVGGKNELAVRVNRSTRQLSQYRLIEQAPENVVEKIISIIETQASAVREGSA